MVAKSFQLLLAQGLMDSLDLATTVLVSGFRYGQWPLHCSRDALYSGRVEYPVYDNVDTWRQEALDHNWITVVTVGCMMTCFNFVQIQEQTTASSPTHCLKDIWIQLFAAELSICAKGNRSSRVVSGSHTCDNEHRVLFLSNSTCVRLRLSRLV